MVKEFEVHSGLPGAPRNGRGCGRPLAVVGAERVLSLYWENDSVRRRCVKECEVCGKKYVGWYD